MITYIGAENIISPLGQSAEKNFLNLKNNKSGITYFESIGVRKENLYLSKISNLKENNKFENIVYQCLRSVIKKTNKNLIKSAKTIVILSTTKANIQ